MRTRWLDGEGEPFPDARMTLLDLAIVALDTTLGVVGEALNGLALLSTLVKSHYNSLVDSEEFHAEVAQAIETITDEGA